MESTTILTFKQYVDRERRQSAEAHELSREEVLRFYPEHIYRAPWWKYVLESFEAGEDFSRQAIVTLEFAQLRDLARTTRALRQGFPLQYAYRAGKLAA